MRSDNKKILFIENQWGLGGSTVFNAKLSSALNKSYGYESKGISLSPFGSDKRFIDDLIGFSLKEPEYKYITRRSLLKKSYKIVSDIKPSLIITTVNYNTCELLRHIPRNVQRIGVVHVVDDGIIKMAKRYASEFDVIVSVSEMGLEMLTSGVNACKEKCVFIPPGILMPEIGYKRILNSKGPLRLLYLGRLNQSSKRARDIVGIAKCLKSSGVNYEWTIAGDGPERDFLNDEIKNMGLTNISLIGSVNHQLVSNLFCNHDVIVSTSEREAFPLALQEAMSHGLVPVAARAPGRVSAIVEQAGGYLVDVNNSEAFKNAIVELNQNRILMGSLSNKAMDSIGEDLSWNSVAGLWCQLMQQMNNTIAAASDDMWSRNPRIKFSRDQSTNIIVRTINEIGGYFLSFIEEINHKWAFKLKHKVLKKFKQIARLILACGFFVF